MKYLFFRDIELFKLYALFDLDKDPLDTTTISIQKMSDKKHLSIDSISWQFPTMSHTYDFDDEDSDMTYFVPIPWDEINIKDVIRMIFTRGLK